MFNATSIHPLRLKESLPTGAPVVFVDNVESDRGAFRRLLGELESVGIERIIVVTHFPADDYVFRAELELTDEDIKTAQENLKRLGHLTVKSNWSNLWHGLLQVAREEQ